MSRISRGRISFAGAAVLALAAAACGDSGRRDREARGCVRVEKPLELAEWVLAGQPEWTEEKIKAAMFSDHEQHVALKRAIPVCLVYATAGVDPDGRISFRDDVYGHDARQMKLLPPSAPTPRLVAANTTAPAGTRGR